MGALAFQSLLSVYRLDHDQQTNPESLSQLTHPTPHKQV